LRRGLKDILIFKERKKGKWKQKTLEPWLHWAEKTAEGFSVSFGYKKSMARPEGFEPPTFGFEVHRSIH
jgi:hypothetical protein